MTKRSEDIAAREALRARQGGGARYDAATAPHDDLLLARRGTAYFARKLNELRDSELYEPALCPGWTRAQVVAHISYHARAIACLIEGARRGVTQPMYPSNAARDAQIALGATLPPRALRSLFRHTEVHLNVEWRDLSNQDWDATLYLLDGTAITARDTPMLRATEVWQGAVDLNNGGRVADCPKTVPVARRGQPDRHERGI